MKPGDRAEVSWFSVFLCPGILCPGASSQPYSRTAVGVRVQEDDPGKFQGAADGGRRGALQSVLSAFEVAHRASAHLGAGGQVVLCPVQKRSRGAALFRCQRHEGLDRATIQKGQYTMFWLNLRLLVPSV